MIVAGRDLRALRPRARWTAWAGAFGYLSAYWFLLAVFWNRDFVPRVLLLGGAPMVLPPLVSVVICRGAFRPRPDESAIERVF